MSTPLRVFGEPPAAAASRSVPIAAKGFRPFFLLAGAFAALALPLWLLALVGRFRPDGYLDATSWHAHEMIFGFSVAVIAGFLLTAVGNWTGRETVVGAPLLALSGLWLAGRVALLGGAVVPPAPAAIVDLAFLPALAFGIGRPLLATGNRRNYVMLAVVGVLWGANLVVHLDALGVLPGWARRAHLFAVDVIVLLIAIMAGRIFPMFTRNATGVASIRSVPALDRLAVGALAALALAGAIAPASIVTAVVAALAAVASAARAATWGTRHTARIPLLWILHLGYAWIPLGLALRAIAIVHPALPSELATHALTVGAIAATTLGMMARVSLGHSGRPLVASRPVALAFVLVGVAAVVRVLVPIAFRAQYQLALLSAGTLLAVAFAIFAVAYAPILATPRADGKPG